MSTGETSLRNPDQNLQLLLDRYSLVGVADNPTIDDLVPEDPRKQGQRADYLYGELTKKGLVHVWADTEKSDYSNARVLVIDHSFVYAGTHVFNRRTGAHDWTEHAGKYATIPLVNKSDALTVLPYQQAIDGLYGDDLEQAQKRYARTIKALAQFAAISGIYDALHQTRALRYPPAPKNLEQLYPYAGQSFGPRVNTEEMLQAGVKFHPSVAQALRSAPDMTYEW